MIAMPCFGRELCRLAMALRSRRDRKFLCL